MAKKKNELAVLEKQLIKEENLDEINEIVDLFNINLQKKNIIRSAKLSDVQDNVVNQIAERFDKKADEFSNEDLIKYYKVIQDTLTKTDTTMENVKAPSIQINQQINVDNMQFDAESRKRILGAVNDILNSENVIEEPKEKITDVDITQESESEPEFESTTS